MLFFLFSTVLNDILLICLHIVHKTKGIAEFIKNDSIQKFTYCPMFLRKILQVLQILQFSSILCIFEPFPAVTVWFWDSSIRTEDNWGTQTQLFQKGLNIHWCFWREYMFLIQLFFFSCGQYVNIFYVKYIIQEDSTKWKITCILYDPSYFC